MSDDNDLGHLEWEPDKDFVDRLKAVVRTGLDFLAEEDPELAVRAASLGKDPLMHKREPGSPWYRITTSDNGETLTLFWILDLTLQESSDWGLIKYVSGRELEIEILDNQSS